VSGPTAISRRRRAAVLLGLALLLGGLAASDVARREAAVRAQVGPVVEVVVAAADLRAGRIRACPATCSPGGCAHPGICRAGEGTAESEATAADAVAAEAAT
jgi:hypothetical protein